jgi:hypothetical protein
MAFLAAAAPYVGLATTAVSAYNQSEAGKEQAANQEVVAIGKEQEAKQKEVEAQTDAQNERRRAKLVRSRALAVAGASGGGVDDPGVTNILDDIDTEGELRALNALSSGEYLARGLRSGAGVARREGSAYRQAGYTRAASTAMDGFTSWADKYGKN